MRLRRTFGIFAGAILLAAIVAPAQAALAAARNIAAPSCGSWVHTTSPDPGTENDDLYAVTALSARNAWAVGEYFVGAETDTLIEHWNGKAWKVVKSPNKGVGDALHAVYAVSADNVWAAGSYGGNTLIEHWNGTSWKVVKSPDESAGSNELTSIRGTSGHDIWAAGDAVTSYPATRTVLLHWNGHGWHAVKSPSVASALNRLSAVRPLSPANAWAVGYTEPGSADKTFILHWTKGRWRVVASPDHGSGSNTLWGVLATSASSAWTVGDYQNGSTDKTLILHWNGRHWLKSSSPDVGNGSNDLRAIGGTSAANIYAAGEVTNSSGTSTKVLILHWNGKRWGAESAPNPGTGDALAAVFAESAHSIWAVGNFSSGGYDRTLIEHCR
jgi:hypothetical protein